MNKNIGKSLHNSNIVLIFAPVKQKRHGRVAQLNRVADYGSAGYRFESCRGHMKEASIKGAFLLGYSVNAPKK